MPAAGVFSHAVAITLADPFAFAFALSIAVAVAVALSVAERLKLGGRPERWSQ